MATGHTCENIIMNCNRWVNILLAPILFMGVPIQTLPKGCEQMENETKEYTNETAEPSSDEDEAWDNATDSGYVSFKQNPIQVLSFATSMFKTGIGQNGEAQFEFVVVDASGEQRTLSTQSIRLMKSLKAVRPLMGKKVRIIRSGDGYATTYTAEEV